MPSFSSRRARSPVGELLVRRVKGDGDTVLYLGGTEVLFTAKGTTKTLSGIRYYTGAGQTIAVCSAVLGTSGTEPSFLAADKSVSAPRRARWRR